MMKKVLMITFSYPPNWSMGTLRSLKFATYLSQFGWHPVVLTARSEAVNQAEESKAGIDVVRTRYVNVRNVIGKLRRKRQNYVSDCRNTLGADLSDAPKLTGRDTFSFFKKLMQDLIFFPDDRIGWYPFGVKDGLEVIKGYDIRAIYSSSAPVTSHLIAHSLKHKTGLPWVADLRDLWTQNHYEKKVRAVAWLEDILEKHVLAAADAVVTVSEPLAAQLSRKYRGLSGKIHVITNGFDPEDFSACSIKKPEKFTITYTGSLYRLRHNPGPLMEAIAELLKDGLLSPEEIALRFVGDPDPALFELAAKHNIERILTVTGRLPYPEALTEQQQASVLLVMVQDDASCEGVFTGKVFEYLGAGRPILALVPRDNVITKLLRETGSGIALAPGDSGALKETLLRWYREYKESGEPAYHPDRAKVMQYTRRNTTRRLASLLDELCVNIQSGGFR